MGHKKLPPASNRKPEKPPSTTASTTAINEGIKREFDRASTALQRGNHSKALRIMKESIPKFDNSATFHRLAGTIFVKVAIIMDDTTVKNKHLKRALESAKKASELSPNSLVNAQFYANLLLERSKGTTDFEEVVAECERALAVEKPVDPAFDKFGSVYEFSAEAIHDRVAYVQAELRSLMDRAKALSVSSWVKNVVSGASDDKSRSIPLAMRQRNVDVDDPYQARLAAIAKLVEYADFEERNANAIAVAVAVAVAVAATVSERKDLVRSFWNSMSYEMKQGLLNIKVSDLKAYLESFSSKDGGQAVKLFSEALEFRIMNHTWKFSACCRCEKRFADATDHLDHVIHAHLNNKLPLKLQSVVPQSVDSEWQEMINSGSWEPMDLTASGRMLEDQSRPGREALKGETSDDTERVQLLRKISSLFQALLRQKCLAMSHLEAVIRYTINELQGLYPGSVILSCEAEQTPRCICFLGASSLEQIVDFLQDLSCNTGYGTSPEEVSVDDIGACQSDSDGDSDFEGITLDESASFLQVDEILLKCDSAGVEAMGSGSSVGGFKKGGQSDFGSFLTGIYTGSHWAKQLATFSITQIERSREGVRLLETLDKEFTQLRSLCEKKDELLEHREALQDLEELFVEECKKREQMPDISYSSYESILRKCRHEIASNRSKLEAIKNLLKGATSIRGNEDPYAVISSDLEADEEDQERTLNQRLDNCIEAALQTQMENMNSEICKLDATMMHKVDDMNQMKAELQQLSVFNYSDILMPLVKSFMKARLEDLAEEYATQKSDAAREAFLAEFVTKGL